MDRIEAIYDCQSLIVEAVLHYRHDGVDSPDLRKATPRRRSPLLFPRIG